MNVRFASCAALLAHLAAPALARSLSAPPHAPARVIAAPFDELAPGFVFDPFRSVAAFDAYASRPSGERVVFDGVAVTRTAEDGTPIATLGTLPGFFFPSFVAIDPSDTFALVGESSNGDIFKVDLALGGLTLLTNLNFNFDATFESASSVLISAATCGFGCGNQLYRVDTTTGSTTQIGDVTGPSGPLARAANGDLYYAVQADGFPPPPNSFSIVRWTAAQVLSGGLTNANATTFVSGLDGAADLAIEPVNGHVFLADSSFGMPGRIVDFNPSGTPVAEIVHTPCALSNLEFFDGTGPGAFQAFQPSDSTKLRYRSTHFTTVQFSRVMHVIPARPLAATAGPGMLGVGDVTVTIRGAVPNASVGIVLCPSSLYSEQETAYEFGTFVFHTGMPLPAIWRVAEVPTDATGNATWTYFNPGNLQGTRVIQAIVKDAHGIRVGSSTAARD